MSSGFVSGGTSDAPIERSDEWLAAQREIEASIIKKQEASRQAATGKSLFETLEANKVAKQEAFEEANKLKNQFRALDQDEVEFLDSVLESTRAEEERVKKETAEGLQLFRKQQEEADKKARREGTSGVVDEGSLKVAEESWIAGSRKRKRTKEKEGLKGVKTRRSSTIERLEGDAEKGISLVPNVKDTTGLKELVSMTSKPTAQNLEITTLDPKSPTPAIIKKPPAPVKIGLVNYVSDEEDD